MTSKLNYSLFDWENEYQQIHAFKHMILYENKKIINIDSSYEKMFMLARKKIINDWLILTDYLDNLVKKIKKMVLKSIERIKINIKFNDIKCSFSGHQKYQSIKIRKFDSIEDLYFAYLDSLHYLIVDSKKCFNAQITYLDDFMSSLKEYKKAVNESEFKYYDYEVENVAYSKEKDAVMVGEELFNQLFIENATIFNGIDPDKIFDAQKFNESVYENFYGTIISNIRKLSIKSSEFYKFNKYLSDNKFTTNIMLELFVKEVDNLDEKYCDKNTIRLYIDNLLYEQNDPKKMLKDILSLIYLKSKVLIEAIRNMFNLDALALFNAEYNSASSIYNIDIEDLRKVKDIINNPKSNIIKNNGLYLDFSKYDLGSLFLSKSAKEDIYEKYINIPYCTTLLFFISNYDITLVSHGFVMSFETFGSMYLNMKKYDRLLFTKCYKEEFDIFESLLNKKVDNFTSKDLDTISLFLLDDNHIDKIFTDSKTNLLMKRFRYSCSYRWFCDEIRMPFINKELTDVEMMIYLLNLNKIDKISLQICNHGFIPNKKCISQYDNSIVWLSNNPLLE